MTNCELIVQSPRRGAPRGVPVVLSDGRTWLLARPGLAPVLADVRDRLYDDLTVARRVRMGDVVQAAWVLLSANYDLADDDLERLLTGAGDRALVDAVLDAVFGPEAPRRTYTTWALSALAANGIDPAKVAPELVPDVLAQLVATGRACPEADYVDSARAAAKRTRLLDMAGGR
jgi:hypothetical protein